MNKEIVLDTEYATLWYYPEAKIVHHQFHKFIYGQEFRDVLEKGLEVFQKNGATKWLADDRKNSALPTDDLKWSMDDWFFRAFKSGWKYWAIIMPDKIAGQLTMNRIMKRNIDEGLNIQVFDDVDEALKWLESV
jgi:hypothetical protein